MALKKKTFKLKGRYENLEHLGFHIEFFKNFKAEPYIGTTDVVQLSYIFKGKAKHYLEGEFYHDEKGCLSITYYNEDHGYEFDDGAMDIMNIYLDLKHHSLPHIPQELSNILAILIPSNPRFVKHPDRVVRLKFENTEKIELILMSLYQELHQKDQGFEDSALSYFQLFLIESCRQVSKDQTVLNSSFIHPKAQKIQQYIKLHYTQKIELKDIAKQTQLSENYLCRFFKQQTGQSIFAYILHLRIQAAMFYLRHYDDKILGISRDCGFNTLSQFNKKFKDIVGMSPSEYRNREGGFTRNEDKER